MAVTATPVFVQTPKAVSKLLTNSLAAIVAGGTNGTKVVGLIATSTSTAAQLVTIDYHDGTTASTIAAINVPALAGTDGVTPAVDLWAAILGLPVDNDGQKYLFLTASATGLRAKAATTSVVSVVAVYGDF